VFASTLLGRPVRAAARRTIGLALALLVPRIGADHHDPPVPANHPALVADGLDARVHLHGCFDPSVSFRMVGRGL